MNRNSNQPVRSSGINLQTLIGILAGAYGFSPIDAVPDFIPLVGYGDDVLVVVVALLLMLLVTAADRGGAK